MSSDRWLRLAQAERMLREPCQGEHYEQHGPDDFERLPCEAYGCPGWRPVPESLETLLKALQQAGYWGIIAWDDQRFVATNIGLPGDRGGSREFADNPLAALEEAACKALGIEVAHA